MLPLLRSKRPYCITSCDFVGRFFRCYHPIRRSLAQWLACVAMHLCHFLAIAVVFLGTAAGQTSHHPHTHHASTPVVCAPLPFSISSFPHPHPQPYLSSASASASASAHIFGISTLFLALTLAGARHVSFARAAELGAASQP